MSENTQNISLSFVADSNKCFSLWLNSVRKEVFDKVKIEVENHEAFNQNGKPSEDYFSINEVAKKITDKITKNIIDKVGKKYENRITKDDSDPVFKTEIAKKLEQACQRSFVSATFIDDKHTNDFNETTGILFIINDKNNKIKILAANKTDAMTSNVDHFIVPDIIMTSKYAFNKLCDWDEHIRQKIRGKIQLDKNLDDAKKEEKKNHVNWLTKSLQTNRVEIKKMCDILYNKANSTKAKTELEKWIDPNTRKLKANAPEVAQLKYDILAKSEVIIKAEKELEQIIKEYNMDNGIIEDGFNNNLALDDLAKENYEQYKNREQSNTQIFFRKNEASIAEPKNWDKYYPDLLKSAFFGSNKIEEQNKRSEYAGYMNIGLRYFFADDKEGREMEKNRFYVFSKNMPKLENETDDQYYKRIVDATMTGARNEIIVALRDVKTMKEDTDKTNQKYYYGINDDNAMKTMDFYVPNLTNYADDTKEAKAKNALLSKEGIKQMFPMMNFFGKNAFSEGVRVYCAKDMKHYKIGDFEAIKTEMQKKTVDDNVLKLTANLPNSEYLAKQQKILEYQSIFTQEYLDFVRQENLNTDIQKELEQNKSLFENLPRYDPALVKESAKIQQNVNNPIILFGTPTPAPIVCSRENSKDSQAFNPEALLNRLNSANSANIRPQNNSGLLQILPNRQNYAVTKSNPPSRPTSSTAPAGFESKLSTSRTNSGGQSIKGSGVSLNGERPPSSVPKLPPINNGTQSRTNSGVLVNGERPPSSVPKLPPI